MQNFGNLVNKNEDSGFKLAPVVKITIENLAQKEVVVLDSSQSLLKIFLNEYIDWMHACGGKGRCTTCKMEVVAGMEQLSPPTQPELKYREQGRLKENERLACQTCAIGNCRVLVPDECKMPHMNYSE